MTNAALVLPPLTLTDFGQLQERYTSLKLAERAKAILKDAEAALATAEAALKTLSEHKHCKQAFNSLRKNSMLIGKMRPSDAKVMLLDSTADFAQGTAHKLAAWRKTMERIAAGEDITKDAKGEYIPSSSALALAMIGNASASSFLSLIQLAFAELAKNDPAHEQQHKDMVVAMRRCATILSDCEVASGLDKVVR